MNEKWFTASHVFIFFLSWVVDNLRVIYVIENSGTNSISVIVSGLMSRSSG